MPDALRLPVRLTHPDAGPFLAGVVLPGGPVAVDASALASFDSSALAVLLELRRRALAQGQAFSVRGLSGRLQELVALYGVGELLPA